MKQLIILFTLTTIFTSFTALGQEDQLIKKQFLIANSSKQYDTALKVAKKISKDLGYKLDLRGYFKSEEGGLDTDEICGCGELHGYIPRGRYDDGIYVSIEYSSAFSGFSKGYYIVVVASGPLGDEKMKETLNEVRTIVKDAYIKQSKVYIGCMH